MCAVTVDVLNGRLVGAVAVPTSCGSAVGVLLKMNEHDHARFRFGATSGWVTSIPESITPTVTPCPVAEPQAFADEAPINDMSH